MGDRLVVLHDGDGLGFLADGCAVLAEEVLPVRLVRTTDGSLICGAGDDTVEVYAELVVAYSRLVRRRLERDPAGTVRVKIFGHLEERIRQALAGEITLPILDLVDRLHGGLSRDPVDA